LGASFRGAFRGPSSLNKIFGHIKSFLEKESRIVAK